MNFPLHPPFRARAGHALLLGACAAFQAQASDTPTAPPSESPALEIGVQRLNGTYQGVGGITLEQDNTAVRLVGDHSNKAEHVLLGGGIRLGSRHHLVGGLSVGREPIPDREAKMKGHSALIRLSAVQPIKGVRQWFVEGLHQRTESRRLGVTDAAFSETTSETEGRTTRTTRTEGVFRTTEWFYGGRRTEVSATVEANVGDDGVAALRWLHGRTRLLEDRESYNRVRLTYQLYLPDHDANWLIGLDNKGRLQLGAEKRLDSIDASLVLMAFKNTRDDKTHGVYLGVRFELGDVPSRPGERPDENLTMLRDTVHALYAPQNYFGTLREDLQRIVTSQTVETTTRRQAPVRKQPVASKPVTPSPEEPTPPPPTPPAADPAPTDIQIAPSNVLTLLEDPVAGTAELTLASPVPAGQLSCSDVAIAPFTNNTCTFSGGNSLISVASDGTVTYGPGTYNPGSFSITVTATDQAGNAHTQTLTLGFFTSRP
jgi:hypothetical protein